jgi:hypothetical protein
VCYLRVPTWAPFTLQFYCNGHSALARSLQREGIEFVQEDNAFLRITDLARAQALADTFNPEHLHRRLKRYARWLCPVADVFAQDDWHWSIRQAEYSTAPFRCDVKKPFGTRKDKNPSRINDLGLLLGPPGTSGDAPGPHHMWSIITCPKPEQLTCVAPSISRAKS